MATLQEIIGLESGAGRSSREVQNLIQRLRQDLRDAQISKLLKILKAQERLV